MTPATRRLWLYGLLLLLPALCVGALAIGLLAREQRRLDEREQVARETRRAAVEARARLIAENIELLLGDVQSALMTTLLEAPAGEPRAFLDEWRTSNPLVSGVFRATPEGRLVWGGELDSLRVWLATTPPWAAANSFALNEAPAAPPVPGAAMAEPSVYSFKKEEARRDISLNVVQYQNARQEIQAVAKLKKGGDALAKSTAAAAPSATRAAPSPPAPPVPGGRADFVADSASSLAAGPDALVYQSQVGAGQKAKSAMAEARMARAQAADALILRSGWTPWRDAVAGLHVFGWRELPDRTVIGLELALAAVKVRLPEVFPAQTEPGERYSLSDDRGRVWHAQGPAEAGRAVFADVPLNAALLPGWTIRGSVADTLYEASSGGVFTLGAMLIALLVFAILAAGALLVRRVRLSEAEAAQKTSFVANVSHELKTPLTTIRLYAELLAQGRVREESKRADYLATIGNETQRLARLVGNVLDFSRLEQGKKKYERTGFDLVAELQRLAAIHGPRLATAGIELRAELPQTRRVTTDRDALEQIVLNLLDNACKYAAEGGEVLLALQTAADGVEVHVADRGPGVEAGQRERIFDKFHRVDERLTAEKSGAGLGLSIARQLARGLGGDLVCRAREGGGAEFVLTLP